MGLGLGERRDCKGCGAPIVGATQADGKGVSPITAFPKENGNVLLWRDVDDGLPRYAIIAHSSTREYLLALGVPLRLNHFADCPKRKDFERS